MNRKSIPAACLLAFAACLTASAQPAKKNADPPTPPSTTKIEDPGIIIAYLLAFALIGGIVGIIAIPSKRGHQD